MAQIGVQRYDVVFEPLLEHQEHNGCRAAAARVEAVHLRQPAGRTRAQHREVLRRIAEAHPDTLVYRSRRRMLRAHPPHDLTALGLAAGPSPAARHRRQALRLWLVGLAGLYAVIAVLARGGAPTAGQALVGLAVFIAWQVALVRLVGSAGDAVAEPTIARVGRSTSTVDRECAAVG